MEINILGIKKLVENLTYILYNYIYILRGIYIYGN